MPGIMENVGILNSSGKLTKEAMLAIVERLNAAQQKGTEKTPPVDKEHQLPADILDENKYPEFHKEVFGTYEGVINSLNLQGNFSLPPPFIDPIALAVKLNPKVTGSIGFNFENLPTINPVSLALMLEITPLDLMSKLSLPPNDPDAIIKPPLPNFSLPAYLQDPAYLKSLANISNLAPACVGGKAFPDKIEYDLWKSPQLGIPKAFAGVLKQLLQDPPKILGMVAPEPNLKFAIEGIQKSEIFGKSDEGEVTKSAVQEDLAKYVGEATGVVALGMAIGDGGKKGATGLCAGSVKLTVTETVLENVEFTATSSAGRKMISIAKAFLGSPHELQTGAKSGAKLVSEAGDAFPNFILQKSYKQEVPEPTGYGTIATTCGLLTPTLIDVLLGLGWESSNGIVDSSGKSAGLKDLPSPIKEAKAAGDKNTPELDTNAGGKSTTIPKGPVGCMIFGKLLRAWIPSEAGAVPEPGDIYFVGANGRVDHTGLIAGGSVVGSPIEVNEETGRGIIITADAGQGAAGRAKEHPPKGVGDTITVGGKFGNKPVLITEANKNEQNVAKALGEINGGTPSSQQTSWSKKGWYSGDYHIGSATMSGDFGEGANQTAKGNTKARPIAGWISISKLFKVFGSSVTNGAEPAVQQKCKRWVEDAYKFSWASSTSAPLQNKVLRAEIVFDETTADPVYYSLLEPDKKNRL